MCRVRIRASLCCMAVCAALVACGDDADTSGIVLGTRDAGRLDAGSDAGKPRADAGRSPGRDAGRDTGAPDSQDDAGTAPARCAPASCAASADECHVGTCNSETDTCELTAKPDDTPCGSSADTECTRPDRCKAGVCVPNHLAAGAPCGDQGVDCRHDDSCDGAGTCTDHGWKTPGSACGSATDTACDNPDTCNALGICQANFEAADTPCGDLGVECHHVDRCNGAGACIDGGLWTTTAVGNYAQCGALGGTSIGGLPFCRCGSQAADECSNIDVCIAGACSPNDINEGDDCGTVGECELQRKCASGTCIATPKADGTSCGGADNDCQLGKECSAGVCIPVNKPDGAPCGDGTNAPPCNLPDTCLDGVCRANLAENGTSCGDPAANRECDGADSCQGGVCDPNHYGPIVCGDPVGECERPNRCSAGACRPDPMLFEPPGTSCGDTTGDDCDDPDSCDGAGHCDENVYPSGTLCGSPAATQCSAPDSCDGTGSCQPNDASEGTPCGNGSSTDCDGADTCDGSGACLANLAPPQTPCGPEETLCNPRDACDGGGVCEPVGPMASCMQPLTGRIVTAEAGDPLEGVEVAVDGTTTAAVVTDSLGRFSIDVPLYVPTILIIGSAPGHWGHADTRVFSESNLDLGDFALYADEEIASLVAAMPGPPSVSENTALVTVWFLDISGDGGEGASIGAAHDGPFTYDGEELVVSSTLRTGSRLHFLVSESGAQTSTAIEVSGNGSNTCEIDGAWGTWPLRPHTVSSVRVTCE